MFPKPCHFKTWCQLVWLFVGCCFCWYSVSTFSCYLHVGSVFTVHSRRFLSFPVRVRWWHRDVCNVCIVLDRSASCCLCAKLPGLTVGVYRVWSLPRMSGNQPARAWAALHHVYVCVCHWTVLWMWWVMSETGCVSTVLVVRCSVKLKLLILLHCTYNGIYESHWTS